MLTRFLFSFAALSLFAIPAIAQNIPAKLAPPREAPLVGKYTAKGVQIYVCTVKGGGSEWSFKAPEAELIDAQGKPFAKHYAGPTWEAPDGSKIVGKILASEPAPQTGAIPWLLLSAASSGSGVLGGARFVQRVNTSGGVGQPARVPWPEQSGVPITQLTTSSTSDWVRWHRLVVKTQSSHLRDPSCGAPSNFCLL